MTLLRNHPKLFGQWPPGWGGWYGKGTKRPFGENPEKLLYVRESDSGIALDVEHDNNEFAGHITIDDSDFRKKFLKVLEQHIGKSIEEIGSIDLVF